MKVKFQNEGQTKYFKQFESRETLTGKYEKNKEISLRSHKYQTDSVYYGQWKGGLRHGNGKMTWKDGASY